MSTGYGFGNLWEETAPLGYDVMALYKSVYKYKHSGTYASGIISAKPWRGGLDRKPFLSTLEPSKTALSFWGRSQLTPLTYVCDTKRNVCRVYRSRVNRQWKNGADAVRSAMVDARHRVRHCDDDARRSLSCRTHQVPRTQVLLLFFEIRTTSLGSR